MEVVSGGLDSWWREVSPPATVPTVCKLLLGAFTSSFSVNPPSSPERWVLLAHFTDEETEVQSG